MKKQKRKSHGVLEVTWDSKELVICSVDASQPLPPLALYFNNENHDGRQPGLAAFNYGPWTVYAQDSRWLPLVNSSLMNAIERFDAVSLRPDEWRFKATMPQERAEDALKIAHALMTDPKKVAARNLLDPHIEIVEQNIEIIKEHFLQDASYHQVIEEALEGFGVQGRMPFYRELGMDPCPFLLSEMKKNSVQGIAAAEILLRDHVNDPRSVAAFRKVLRSCWMSAGILSYAIRAAAHWGSYEDVEVLLLNVERRQDESLYPMTVKTLGTLGYPFSQAFLLNRLSDRDDKMLPMVIEALGRCGNDLAVEPMLALAQEMGCTTHLGINQALSNIQTRMNSYESGAVALKKSADPSFLTHYEPDKGMLSLKLAMKL